MASIKQVSICIKKLAVLFDYKNVSDELFAIYCEMLSDINDEVLVNAINECLLKCKFFPSIAEVREHIPKELKKLENQIEQNLFWLERGQPNPHAADKQIATGIFKQLPE